MKEEEFGPIEQDITKEEQAVSGVKTPIPSRIPKLLSKIKGLIFSIKKPRVITVIILTLAIFVIYLSLELIGQKQQEEAISTKVREDQPSPETSQDPTLANIAQRVESYSKKIDALDSYKKRLTKPIVDLEIMFK